MIRHRLMDEQWDMISDLFPAPKPTEHPLRFFMPSLLGPAEYMTRYRQANIVTSCSLAIEQLGLASRFMRREYLRFAYVVASKAQDCLS